MIRASSRSVVIGVWLTFYWPISFSLSFFFSSLSYLSGRFSYSHIETSFTGILIRGFNNSIVYDYVYSLQREAAEIGVCRAVGLPGYKLRGREAYQR